MTTRTAVFGTLGRVAVLFSTLEADLDDALCHLANEEHPMLVATLLGHTPFARKIEILANLARFQRRLFKMRIEQLTKVLKPLRKKRNLFIHGRWDLSANLLKEGKVRVTDSKIDYEENAHATIKSWRKGISHEFDLSQLREFEVEIMRALKVTREVLPKGKLFYSEITGRVISTRHRGDG